MRLVTKLVIRRVSVSPLLRVSASLRLCVPVTLRLCVSDATNSLLRREFEDPGSRDYRPGLVWFGRIKEGLGYVVPLLF
jgi:hypothetical protein